MELLINFNSGESLKLLLRFDSNSFFSLSTFPIRSTCYTSLYTFTRWKTYNNFLLNRTVASFPDSIVVGSNFPSDKLFLELWHSIHGAESCESYYPKKEHARKAKLSSNIYAFLSTSVLLRHGSRITDANNQREEVCISCLQTENRGKQKYYSSNKSYVNLNVYIHT